MGSQQIEGVWISPEIDSKSSCLLPFGFSVGNHRAIILDVPTTMLLGIHPPQVVCPNARRLQSNNPKVQHCYLSYLEDYISHHNILQKLQKLYVHGQVDQATMESIDQILTDGMRAAEYHCRKLCMGCVEFSPELNKLGKIWELWKIVCRYKLGANINRGRIKRMARALEITAPLSESYDSACYKRTEARILYVDRKPDAADLRLAFLSENEEIPIHDREDEADRLLDMMIKREEARAVWRHINACQGVQHLSSVTKVTESRNGLEIHRSSKSEVERSIISEVSQRFRLTENWSPFRTGPLAEEIGFVAEKGAAEAILNGTFEPSYPLDNHTKAVLQHLRIPDAIRKQGPINISLTAANFQKHWQRAKESTSSSPSGIHFSHYKVASHHIVLSEIHALKTHIGVNHGISLSRWTQGLQIMLMKELDNYSVERLRVILLIEADYNWMTSTLIGQRLIGQAMNTNELPPEHFGGIKGSAPIDLGASRVLFWDVL
jgi:hypothetical protein